MKRALALMDNANLLMNEVWRLSDLMDKANDMQEWRHLRTRRDTLEAAHRQVERAIDRILPDDAYDYWDAY